MSTEPFTGGGENRSMMVFCSRTTSFDVVCAHAVPDDASMRSAPGKNTERMRWAAFFQPEGGNAAINLLPPRYCMNGH
ncbi:MAG: hypothetical protein HOH66_08120 [Rhodospirillaceae bacterium]|nr:hypothetical protein [Rhodospirillaceae bacterium]